MANADNTSTTEQDNADMARRVHPALGKNIKDLPESEVEHDVAVKMSEYSDQDASVPSPLSKPSIGGNTKHPSNDEVRKNAAIKVNDNCC